MSRFARHGSGSSAAAFYESRRRSPRTENPSPSDCSCATCTAPRCSPPRSRLTAARAQDTRALVRYVDSVANAAVAEHRTAGVSVAIVKNGARSSRKATASRISRTTCRRPRRPSTASARSPSSSPAAAIMRLVEQGKLSLDDTLQKFLPNFPTQGNRVTVRHLLNHTSGSRATRASGPKWQRVDAARPRARFAGRAVRADEPFDFKPGDALALRQLGLFPARHDHREDERQAVRRSICRTSSSRRSASRARSTATRRRSSSIARRVTRRDPTGSSSNAEPLSMTQPYAAGSLCSTVTDLAAGRSRCRAARW